MTRPSIPSNPVRLCLAIALSALGIVSFWNALPKKQMPPLDPIAKPVSYAAPGELLAIQDVQLGQRVMAKNPTGEVDNTLGTTVDPATWRKLTAVAPKIDGSLSYVELLRPSSWLNEQNAGTTGLVTIQVPECGISGEALLLAVEPCPVIAPGTGPIVTGYYQHQSATVVDVHVEGLAQPIGATANHPFWSMERKRFVPAGELAVGEHLSGIDSSPAVTAIELRKSPESIFNLEILGEHCFRVSSLNLLVHNPECYDPNTLLSIGRIDRTPPITTYGDGRSIGAPHLPLRQGDIDQYRYFKLRGGDDLSGHEVWQSANTSAYGLGGRTGAIGGRNPAIALSTADHKIVNKLQAEMIPDARAMSAIDNIRANVSVLKEAQRRGVNVTDRQVHDAARRAVRFYQRMLSDGVIE